MPTRWVTLGAIVIALCAGVIVYLALDDHEGGQEPTETQKRRDLLFRRMRIGDLRLEQGDIEGALKAHQESLAIAVRGATDNPANPTWQRDLAVIHFRLSYAFREAGDYVQAQEHGRVCVSIYRRLAETDAQCQSESQKVSAYLEQLHDAIDQPDASKEPPKPANEGPGER